MTSPSGPTSGTAPRVAAVVAAVVAVVGNPKPHSRTAALATAVAEGVAALGAGSPGGEHPDERGSDGHAEVEVLDLAELTDRLGAPLGAGSAQRWSGPLARIHAARVLVVATPTYKGSYTGLLKSFLDHVGGGALQDIVAIPVTTVGSPAHTLAADVHLRPLLTELGASTPTGALVVGGAALDDPAGEVAGWLLRNDRVLRLALGLQPQPVPV